MSGDKLLNREQIDRYKYTLFFILFSSKAFLVYLSTVFGKTLALFSIYF